MESGRVKWFNTQKRFGFIVPDDDAEEQLWFHFNDGQIINAVKGKRGPQFIGAVLNNKHLRDPREGDKVVFERLYDSMGRPKACPWGYDTHYQRALGIIAKWPPPTTYRVLETINAIGQDPGKPKVLWEGTDLEELLRLYPVPKGNQSPSADSLLPYYSDSDNIFEIHRWFEQKTETGWEKRPDPRPLPGVNRQFERITHGW